MRDADDSSTPVGRPTAQPLLRKGKGAFEMPETITLTIDGVPIEAQPGQNVIEAADAAGIYIPRLCHKPGLEPFGSCRLCTVLVNGRPCSACTTPSPTGWSSRTTPSRCVNSAR